MTGRQLQKLIDAAGKSARGLAKEMGIGERTMRKFLSGDLTINKRTAVAARCLCEHQHLNSKPTD